ncbi:ShlB/FhaC/HecB family hemolysin secretion/activation protein [Arcobacter vandammei]|uniref:ShlB/FhaC/HecB family hemolysin secretion/activation protein n=1 Tax=Arcobacter vandammei TaxID=2782243 RepID=UPI001D1830E0|nr:ShlB/FhaC/HecB family hemolysin secretion/activation protein [Arcobacter vandammei]
MRINRIIGLSLLSSILLLGATPNSNTIDRQIQTPRDIPTFKKDDINIEGVKSDSVKTNDSTQKVFVKNFTFVGNSKISNDELSDVVKNYVNKELTFNQIQEVLAIVTKTYRDKRYFVARAYLGKQDLLKNDNALQISIVEGNYEDIKLNNSSLVNDNSLEAILNNSKSNETINVKDIERALLLINDRAGVQISSSVIEPGNSLGTSNITVYTLATPRVDGYVVADNYGSRYTGYYRLQTLVNINSLIGVGDKLSLSGLISNGADLKNGKLAYEVPLNSYGLKADFAYSRTNYDLVKEYKPLDAKGNSNIYEVGLSYPLIRSTNENLYLKGKYFHKDLNDYMDSSFNLDEKRNINSFVASLDYDKNYSFFNLPARVFANLNFTTGHLNSTLNKVNDGNYNKIDAYIANDIYFSEIFSLKSNLTAQKVLGNKNLNGNEDIYLGGAYGVKVYPDSEQSAENGYMLNLELLSNLPKINSYSHRVGLFYDMGNVYEEKQDVTFKRKTLQDVGFGYYANYKDFFARVQMAWAINHEVSDKNEPHQNSKLLFQAGWVF